MCKSNLTLCAPAINTCSYCHHLNRLFCTNVKVSNILLCPQRTKTNGWVILKVRSTLSQPTQPFLKAGIYSNSKWLHPLAVSEDSSQSLIIGKLDIFPEFIFLLLTSTLITVYCWFVIFSTSRASSFKSRFNSYRSSMSMSKEDKVAEELDKVFEKVSRNAKSKVAKVGW